MTATQTLEAPQIGIEVAEEPRLDSSTRSLKIHFGDRLPG
jgi:hypothetical protein